MPSILPEPPAFESTASPVQRGRRYGRGILGAAGGTGARGAGGGGRTDWRRAAPQRWDVARDVELGEVDLREVDIRDVDLGRRRTRIVVEVEFEFEVVVELELLTEVEVVGPRQVHLGRLGWLRRGAGCGGWGGCGG